MTNLELILFFTMFFFKSRRIVSLVYIYIYIYIYIDLPSPINLYAIEAQFHTLTGDTSKTNSMS